MDDLLGWYVEVSCLQCLRHLLLVAQCLKTIQDRPPGVIGEQARFQMRKELPQRAVMLWEAILLYLPDRINIEATPGVEERLDDRFEKGAVLDEGRDRLIANCLPGTGEGALQDITPLAPGGTSQPILSLRIASPKPASAINPNPASRAALSRVSRSILPCPPSSHAVRYPVPGLPPSGSSPPNGVGAYPGNTPARGYSLMTRVRIVKPYASSISMAC